MNEKEVTEKSLLIRDMLIANNNFKENLIDDTLPPIPPFKVSDYIKLIIIGQDPTIREADRRKFIKVTLNLDKDGSLKTYLNKFFNILSIKLENVYATNIFKYFYTIPPADTFEILQQHLKHNLDLVKEEISDYPNVPIIALGEPVLKLLIKNPELNEMKYYWDNKNYKTNKPQIFKYSLANENLLNRDFFPFPHQPTGQRNRFYIDTLEKYSEFMKQKITI